MRKFRQFPGYLAAWMIWASAPSRAAITVSAPDVTEGDAGPVNAEFSYGLPAAANPASYEFALLPHRLAAGRDFSPWQTVLNLPAGPAVSGIFNVPILPDGIPEENGLLYLVARPPQAATWAQAMTSPATVEEFSGANGASEVMYWQDGAVIARRRSAGISYVDLYDRTTAAGMVLKSTLPAPATSPDIFHQANVAFSDRVIVVSQPGGLNTWLRDASAADGWRKLETLPVPSPAKPFIAGDRLFLNILNRSAVYRLDPSLPAGWRQTGGMEARVPLGVREDLAVVVQYSSLEIWERSGTTEDIWNPAYLIGNPAGNIYVGAAEGMVVTQGPAGLDIHERGGDGITWGKAGTLPVTAASDELVTAAPTGDWIAVARVKAPDAATQGAKVALFLRNALNRSLWTAVGEIDYPEARSGSKFFWDRGELILSSFRDDITSVVISRSFQGGSALVKDDDRSKLALAAAIQLEPESGSAAAECYAEFPLPVPQDLPVSYEFAGGSAVAGQDFNAVAGTVVIPAGSSRVLIPINLLSDDAVESDKTLIVRLSVPNQPTVEESMVVRDTDPAPVVTAEATPLLEGYEHSTVTLRQTPATGTILTADPVTLKMQVGGFVTSSPDSTLATEGADISETVTDLELTAAAPAASFSLTATQDILNEPAEEKAMAVWTSSTSRVSAGGFGIGLDTVFPPSASSPNVGIDLCAAGGDWVFVLRSNSDPGIFFRYVIDCFRRIGQDRKKLEFVHRFTLDSNGTGSAFSTPRIQMQTDGHTLAISATRDMTVSGGTRNILGIYRTTGPVNAPWQLDWEWNCPLLGNAAEAYPLHLITDNFLGWGPWLLERSSGPWGWRLLNDAVTGQFVKNPTYKILDTDGRRIVFSTPTAGESVVYQRIPGALSEWRNSPPIVVQQSGFATPIESAWIRGRTLYLLPQYREIVVYRGDDGGEWKPDTLFPNARGLMSAGETTACFNTGGEIKILSRIGPASAPWVQTGKLPTDDVGSLWPSPHSPILSYVQPGAQILSRFRIYEPGLPLTVLDDDTLTFLIQASSTTVAENHSGETVKKLKLAMNRRPPFPVTIRIRSRDTGSAIGGVDYAPVDRNFEFKPDDGDALYGVEFPVRIFSDRNLEGAETFHLQIDRMGYGTVPAPTIFTITDPVTNGFKVIPETTILMEPVNGSLVQSVEFTFQSAFDRDVIFTPNQALAGLGTQFDFPIPSVVLKAGSNSLRIPIRIFADSLDEVTQTIPLSLSSSPPLPGLTTTALSVLDATVAGLLGDENYATSQLTTLTADGLAGHPQGVQANDVLPPLGASRLSTTPSWGVVIMQPDGSFTATPSPNVIGPHIFAYQAETIPYLLFVNPQSPWKYLHPVNGVSPSQADPSFTNTWATAGFNDSNWADGTGTMSYGGFAIPVFPNVTELATPPSGARYTSYFRATFSSSTAVTLPLRIQLYCDDGAVIYINGVERGRAFTGTPATNFPTFPDTYTMISSGNQTEAQEGTLQNVVLGNVPLNAGPNVLAISLHNLSNTSTDLGLRVERLETGELSGAVPVTVTFTDANLPLVTQSDTFNCPQNAVFLSSEDYGASLFTNDGLFSPDGSLYDPVTEIVVSPVSTGTLEMIGDTGHFRYTPPADFAGTAGFTYQIRDKDGLSQPVMVTLNVQPVLPFDVWRQQNLPAGGDGAASEADADGDGWNNFLEYALTSMPGNPVPAPGIGPEFAFDTYNGVPRFSVKLRRAPDIAYSMESAMSLESPVWQTLYESRGLNYSYIPPGSYVQFLSGTALSQTVIVNPKTTLTASPRLFYRLRAERILPQ